MLFGSSEYNAGMGRLEKQQHIGASGHACHVRAKHLKRERHGERER